MYTKRVYGFWMTFWWSRKPFFMGLVYAAAVFVAAWFIEDNFALPWQPVSIIGIAVAFYLGFKNNSSYDRSWEARKIWGSIVNNSRSFSAAVIAFARGDKQEMIHKELIYRHIAWLTALRYQLRMRKKWEHQGFRFEGETNDISKEDYVGKMKKELAMYLDENDLQEIEGKSNLASQILRIQSERLQDIHEAAYYDDFRHMELQQLISTFYTDQGKSERIKNFPFPRQYASAALWLTFIFSAFVPFGVLDVFEDKNHWTFWTAPVISALITWIFMLMEKIGDYSENPFEGTANDVPISNIARGIEIDIRQMINDKDIPNPTEERNGFLM